MLFMLATTVTAGIQNIFDNYLPAKTFNGNLNAFLSAAMLILVSIIIVDSSIKWVQYIRKHGWVHVPEKVKISGKKEDTTADIGD
jgi:carbon starvation protein